MGLFHIDQETINNDFIPSIDVLLNQCITLKSYINSAKSGLPASSSISFDNVLKAAYDVESNLTSIRKNVLSKLLLVDLFETKYLAFLKNNVGYKFDETMFEEDGKGIALATDEFTYPEAGKTYHISYFYYEINGDVVTIRDLVNEKTIKYDKTKFLEKKYESVELKDLEIVDVSGITVYDKELELVKLNTEKAYVIGMGTLIGDEANGNYLYIVPFSEDGLDPDARYFVKADKRVKTVRAGNKIRPLTFFKSETKEIAEFYPVRVCHDESQMMNRDEKTGEFSDKYKTKIRSNDIVISDLTKEYRKPGTGEEWCGVISPQGDGYMCLNQGDETEKLVREEFYLCSVKDKKTGVVLYKNNVDPSVYEKEKEMAKLYSNLSDSSIEEQYETKGQITRLTVGDTAKDPAHAIILKSDLEEAKKSKAKMVRAFHVQTPKVGRPYLQEGYIKIDDYNNNLDNKEIKVDDLVAAWW